MVSRDENEWFYDEPANKKTPIRNIVRQRRSAYTSDVSTPVEGTELFLDNDILIIIVECTNKEGRMAFGEKKSEWVDTDKVEIQAFLAFLATLLSVGSMKHGMIDLKLVFHEVGGSLFGKDSRSHFIRAVASGLAQAQLFRRQEIPTLSHYLKEAISISLANLGQDKPRQTRKGLPQPSTPQSESKGRQQVKKQQDDKKSFCCITCNNTQDKKAATQMQNLPLEKGQKVITTCSKCGGFVCGEQRHFVCSDCMNAHNVTSN
ncbi:hypothetical protein RRG08_015601 [Elysia crispata]|uniref:PiggyBac transposable element-derived protein domain-containing protein n=1 Tax=Elysia crispata TaxID=231223 RepID=A0AAE0YHJ8_9GAST|nr:hypothetical protein RRG08_015601 [Elysia crispata]